VSHIVIDTDILIDAGRGIKQALQYIQQCEATRAISVITKMELMVGCRDKNEMHHINKFLTSFQLLNIDEGISTTATQLLMQYRLSHGLLIPDAFIAATAICWNYPLISKNQRDYRFIDNLNLLHYFSEPNK